MVADKMPLDKVLWTKWYGQNGMNKTVSIKSSINLSISLPCTDNMIYSSTKLPL